MLRTILAYGMIGGLIAGGKLPQKCGVRRSRVHRLMIGTEPAAHLPASRAAGLHGPAALCRCGNYGIGTPKIDGPIEAGPEVGGAGGIIGGMAGGVGGPDGGGGGGGVRRFTLGPYTTTLDRLSAMTPPMRYVPAAQPVVSAT